MTRLDAPSGAPADAPRLSIRQQANQVVLSWPTNNAAGFALYYATGASGRMTWNAMPAASLDGGQYVVTDSASAGTRFYRLKK